MVGNKIAWKIIELKRTKWEDNEDITQESSITHTAHSTLMHVLTEIQSMLEEKCSQDISTFKIVDKSYGEISLAWYGDVFELDLDILAEGGIGYLLCWAGDTNKDNWRVESNTTADEFILALKGYAHASI